MDRREGVERRRAKMERGERRGKVIGTAVSTRLNCICSTILGSHTPL